MKQWFILLLLAGLFSVSCTPKKDAHNHDDHSGHNHGEDAHDDHSGHDHGEITSAKFTTWTNKAEYFIEFNPLAKGQKNKVVIHLNDVDQFKPIPKGELFVYLKQGNEKIASAASPIKSKGVTSPQITPKASGKADLWIIISTPAFKDTAIFKNLSVAKDAHDAAHISYPNKDPESDITYLKEEAWLVDFATKPVSSKKMGELIHSSGYIRPATTDITTITAKRDGIVHFTKKNVTTGTAVRSNELLFSIAGEGILEDDLSMNFQKSKSNFDRCQADVQRKEKLLEDKIIGEKEYRIALNEFEVAKADFDNIQALYKKGAKRHLSKAPHAGSIAQLMVTEGQFVEAGAPLATVLKSSKLQVDIDVAPKYQQLLPQLHTATFINPNSEKTYTLEELNGKILSYGRMINHEGNYLPVFFEINNHPDLLPGTLLEAYLQTKPTQSILAVPRTSILEEMGSYVVFVQVGGESFEKRVVSLGKTDGVLVEILDGVQLGERVVTKGVNRVKLASMASDAPAHGHVH
ncbi:MAG: efflux RND transporter periplasmic adaptor subunit [Aureispira sp.]|nr:efflux RND transporter periplasmic adaptor subunit [Aureispira sp.]